MEYELKANKLLKKSLVKRTLESLGYDVIDYDEAQHLMMKAAYEYKLQKDYLKSAETFASCLNVGNDKLKSIECLTEIVDCYKKIFYWKEAICYLKKLAATRKSKSEFEKVAICYNDIAKLYESNASLDKALHYYDLELDILQLKNKWMDIAKRMNELALFFARQSDYVKAAECFEKVVNTVNHPDYKYGMFHIRKHMLDCLLCILATGDIVKAKNMIVKFEELDYSFINSHEHKFIISIVKCVDRLDESDLSMTCQQYNDIYTLDAFKVAALLVIKESLHVMDEEFDLS